MQYKLNESLTSGIKSWFIFLNLTTIIMDHMLYESKCDDEENITEPSEL